MVVDSVFFQWSCHSVETQPVAVFPDGCRDVLIIHPPGARTFVTLTPFDFHPRPVALLRGRAITGYRLRPGSAVDQPVLDAIAADSATAPGILSHDIGAADDVGTVIDALALPGASVGGAARSLGTSVRTLQRHLAGLHLPPPDYWRLLARARRAAAVLADHASLTDVAHSTGFTDQAHMTREFVRWFGQTPGGLRRRPKVLDMLRQPALGNWTGEQISTRSPLTSLT